jgi:signal transduction histidine kinase
VMNLVVNARDAMPKGGEVVIETSDEEVGRCGLPGAPEVPPGAYVVLAVKDSGTGMDAQTAKRAIEPFFTTKDVGKGTGLGLSQVYGIASQLGGALTILSTPGNGTSVRVFLPRSE